MDYNLLILIGMIIATVGIIFLIKFLKKRNIIDETSINTTSDLLKISTLLIEELKIKDEDKNKIILISTIIIDGLNRSVDIMGMKDIEQIKIYVADYVFALCVRINIDLTENRKLLIEMMIKYLIENKYSKQIID